MRKRTIVSTLLFLLPLPSIALTEACHVKPTVSNTMRINDIPSREQWNSTNGYCGEVSLISAGLFYGQYMSQYDARALANLDFPGKKPQLTQILIGYSDAGTQDNNVSNALKNMHLSYEQFDNKRPATQATSNFLTWIKTHVLAQHPVAIGVYENASVFDGAREEEYDHIVPVIGIGSKQDLLQTPVAYYGDDVLYFRDNVLYTGEGYSTDDCYAYPLSSFQKSRQKANAPSSGLYSLSDNSNKKGNFGIAVTGVAAKGVALMPVSIKTNPVSEYPEIKEQSNDRPAAQQIRLAIKVSELKPQTWYVLYKYKNFADLPVNDDFSLSYGTPAAKCSIWLDAGSVFSTKEQISSNEMAIYRAMASKEQESLPPACVEQK